MYSYLIELMAEIFFNIFSNIRRVAYLAIGIVTLCVSLESSGDVHWLSKICGLALIFGVIAEGIWEMVNAE